MAGNVWEWCSDWYDGNYYKTIVNLIAANPQGPSKSYDPMDPYTPKRSLRGGSFYATTAIAAVIVWRAV